MKNYLIVGATVLAGAALLEAALVPGVLIGGVAVLAPRLFLGNRRRGRPPDAAARRIKSAAARPDEQGSKTRPALQKLSINQAIVKTITFQTAFTTVDFAAHYAVLGDLASSAALSTSHFIVGPALYLPHEAAWNFLRPARTELDGPDLLTFQLPTPGSSRGHQELMVSRPIAKTVTFRTIASVAEFTAHYIVVGNLATATALSAFGFVVGPFIYLGHEMLWDRFGSAKAREAARPAPEWMAAF